MTSIQKEIADIFNECMGFHEGIEVPDCHVGHSSMDYADKILKLIEKRIDERIQNDKEVVTNLIKNGESLESKPLIRLTSRIDGYIGIKEMLK